MFLTLNPNPGYTQFFRDFITPHKIRHTDVIKFRLELTETFSIATMLKTKEEVFMKIKTFMEENKENYAPYTYYVQHDGDNENFNIFLSVNYDGFEFESFNMVHMPVLDIVGMNYSNEFKTLMMKENNGKTP